MDRRDFIKQILASLGALFLGAGGAVKAEEQETEHPLEELTLSDDITLEWDWHPEDPNWMLDYVNGMTRQIAQREEDEWLSYAVDTNAIEIFEKYLDEDPVPVISGKIFYVNWEEGPDGGDDTNDGLTPETALASEAEALRRCSAPQGDLIYVLGDRNDIS